MRVSRPRSWRTPLVAGVAAMVASCSYLPLGKEECGPRAKVCQEPTVMALAHDLDHLEKHIEQHGSIVAKQPDVWGQARMTKHRAEFETQMSEQLGGFKESLQGALARSDQAYFANSLVLSAAISGRQAALLPPAPIVTETVTATQTQTDAAKTTQSNALNQQRDAAQKVTEDLTMKGTLDTSNEQKGSVERKLATSTPGTVTVPDQSQTAPQVTAIGNVVRTSTTPALGGFSVGGTISLEPTQLLNQRARFLNHLHELRRINEGDDTADSPGYSLNLVRIPVSLLPGKHTDVGYGAEITFTMTPYIGEELLPTTFRNLIINDLVEQIGLPLTQVLNDKDIVANYLTEENAKAIKDELQNECAAEGLFPPLSATEANTGGGSSLAASPNRPLQKRAKTAVQTMRKRIAAPTLPATKTRRARMPFPPSQIFDVYGFEPVYNIAHEAHLAFQRDPANRNKFIHYPDVQGYLQEELAGAYKLLSHPHNRDLWRFCGPDLAAAVRSHQYHALKEMRCQFLATVQKAANPEQRQDPLVADPARLTVAALAWAVLVESALLNDQLLQDMKEVAAAKGCACLPGGGWLPFFLPDPPPEARHAFAEYVRCRWPIHVFAIDPVTEDQNIADIFSLRREMQLAVSLAFASGRISARNMTQYARRIELDTQTVALNRTVVGFSHGEDTFGWRFYPRYQTPDIEGNATVLFRDLLGGGPSKAALLRQRRLEPGSRECVAVVIMPSFVPYVTVDSSASWFKLTDPKCKDLTSADAMRLSRTVRSIQNCGCRVSDGDCYRGGDLPRLLRRAEQLSARLPLQTRTVQVPIENTLGGFAMFANGVTDLAPQLSGWYGVAGIDPAKPTSLFLVGDHFSVHQTRVLAGGLDVQPTLLSRQVLAVTVPPGAQVTGDNNGPFVDVHVATPYGVTHHLLVPVVEAAKAKSDSATPAEGFSLTKTDVEASYAWSYNNGSRREEMLYVSSVPAVALTWNNAAGHVLPTVHVSFEFEAFTHSVAVRIDKTVNGSFPINLEALVAAALGKLNESGQFNRNNPPDGAVVLRTKQIVITPAENNGNNDPAGHAVKRIVCSNNLAIRFKRGSGEIIGAPGK